MSRSILRAKKAVVFFVFQLLFIATNVQGAEGPIIGGQYMLTNAFLKDEKVLSLDSQGRLYMESRNPNNTKQRWMFSQGPNGTFYMHNLDLGATKAVDSDSKRPNIKDKGNYTGQYWRYTQEGEYFRISNAYQGLNRVLDTENAPGNYVFFEAKTRNTSGTKWKLNLLPTVVTTSIITLPSAPRSNPCPDGQTFVKGSNGQLFNTVDRCETIQTEFVIVAGLQRNARDYINIRPCKAVHSKSLLLERKESNQQIKIANNNCAPRSNDPSLNTYFYTTQTEFEQVSQFFVHLENTFIRALKENPSVVLNYKNKELVERLRIANGLVSYSEMEAFVYGELINSLKKRRGQRTSMEQAAVNWLVRGALAAELMVWNTAQEQYRRWKSDPCSFKPPGKFHGTKWDGMYANCGGSNNPLASAFGGALFEVEQGNPKISNLIEWGGYLAGGTLLAAKQEGLVNRSISMSNVYIIGAAGATTAGVVSVIAVGSGTIAASIFPISTAIAAAGGVFTLVAPGAAATAAPVALGAGALAGPAIVVVGAVVGTVAAITMNIEDTQFHNRMNTSELIFNYHGTPVKLTEIGIDKAVDLYALRIKGEAHFGGNLSGIEQVALSLSGVEAVEETDPSGAIEFAFTDAMYSKNGRRFLPVTVPTTYAGIAN